MRGFTLIEILIVVAGITILASIVLFPLASFRRTAQLSSAIEEGVSLLVSARLKTLSSEGATQYGVHFETVKMVFFVGTTYITGNPQNSEVLIPNDVEISTISLNGGAVDVVFKRLTGETDQHGTVLFRLKSDPSNTKTLRIEQTGAVHGA
ncbi:MAG: Uncharacterized protein G01um101429_758 [Parcubacteria group bacterium Gr01-1014_29]|nr:MAG: Uncharacterized protein G01um101429_758 [Parcubacteria group bacterium Gr01-1014_29]